VECTGTKRRCQLMCAPGYDSRCSARSCRAPPACTPPNEKIVERIPSAPVGQAWSRLDVAFLAPRGELCLGAAYTVDGGRTAS